MKKYWTDRLKKARTPFLLRLINGMVARAPEVTVRIDKVRKNARSGNDELYIGRIIEVPPLGSSPGATCGLNSRS